MITESWLELVYACELQEMEDIWAGMNFQKCQMDQLRTQINLSLTFKLDSSVWGVGAEGIHLENAGRIVSLHRCTQIEVKIVEKDFCTDGVPVPLGHGKEMVLKFMNPVNKVFYQTYTLTKCSPLYSNLMRHLNGTGITFGEKIEVARVGPVSI